MSVLLHKINLTHINKSVDSAKVVRSKNPAKFEFVAEMFANVLLPFGMFRLPKINKRDKKN